MKITFDMELAEVCGVPAAIVADYLWQLTELDENAAYRDGGIWVRCPMWQIRNCLQVLSKHQIEEALRILRKQNMIRSEQLEKKKFDHANWYRFTERGIELMESGWKA